LVELGPDGVLSGMVEEDCVPTLRRDMAEDRALMTALGALHTRGIAVDWEQVFAGTGARRTHLPTYAFQKQRFWIEGDGPGTAEPEPVADPVDAEFWDAVERGDADSLAQSLQLTATALDDVLPALSTWRRRRQEQAVLDSWRYRINWRPVSGASADPAVSVDGTWLLLVPADHTGPSPVAIAGVLEARGARVLRVDFNADAEDRGVLAGLIRPRTDAGQDGQSEPVALAGVVSLLALDDRPHSSHPTLSVGLAATITLVQALGDLDVRAPLWCVTSGAVAVRQGAEVTSRSQPMMWGLGTVLALDHPQTWGGLVDLPAEPDERALGHLIAALAGTGGEDQVAIRPEGVFARRMERAAAGAPAGTGAPAPASAQAPAPASSPSPPADAVRPASAWTPRGTVLITGGTGGIGAHVARWAAARGAGHLLLLSRRGPAAEGAEALEAELGALGARVTVVACDVTDRDALAGVLDAVPAADPVTAVFHTAGVAQEPRPLADTTVEEFAEVGRAKIAGAAHLDELTAGHRLDAFVLFSSGAAAWGGAGQSGYAAANAYVEGLAHRRRADGLAATAVAWGAWGGGGMVDEAVADEFAEVGVELMRPELAVAALAQALDGDEGHLVVAGIEWSRFAPSFLVARERPLLRGLPEVTALMSSPAGTGRTPGSRGDEDGREQQQADVAALLSRLLGLPAEAQQQLLTDLVLTEAGRVLGHDKGSEPLEDGVALLDVGFDSLTGLELRNRLNRVSGLELPQGLIFDAPTAGMIAELMLEALAPELAVTPESVAEEFDKLDMAVAPAMQDGTVRAQVVSRLRELLVKWDDVSA